MKKIHEKRDVLKGEKGVLIRPCILSVIYALHL